jgi:predicted RND superfamily exporter protein
MFSVYLFSPMRFLMVLGILIIIGLSSALLADYTITPALLHVAKPFGKEKENV